MRLDCKKKNFLFWSGVPDILKSNYTWQKVFVPGILPLAWGFPSLWNHLHWKCGICTLFKLFLLIKFQFQRTGDFSATFQNRFVQFEIWPELLYSKFICVVKYFSFLLQRLANLKPITRIKWFGKCLLLLVRTIIFQVLTSKLGFRQGLKIIN